MWHRTNVLLAATVAILAWPGDASAQTRKGFWFGAGGGYGGAAACKEDGCGERKNSGVAYLQGGYTLNEQLLVGGEFGFWSKNYSSPTARDYQRVSMYSLTGTATYYPRRTGGLFAKGGAGIALIDSQVKAVAVQPDLGKGLGLIVGGGYDIAVGTVAITPAFNYWYGRLGDLKISSRTFAFNHRQNVLTVTVGITVP
jgi:hypothetical protein